MSTLESSSESSCNSLAVWWVKPRVFFEIFWDKFSFFCRSQSSACKKELFVFYHRLPNTSIVSKYVETLQFFFLSQNLFLCLEVIWKRCNNAALKVVHKRCREWVSNATRKTSKFCSFLYSLHPKCPALVSEEDLVIPLFKKCQKKPQNTWQHKTECGVEVGENDFYMDCRVFHKLEVQKSVLCIFMQNLHHNYNHF